MAAPTHTLRCAGQALGTGLAVTARFVGRLVRRLARTVRVVAWWLTCAGATWTLIRAGGLPTVAATAIVGGVLLVAAGVVWWALVVEPWLFAPRPSTRPRVVRATPGRPLTVEEAEDMAITLATAYVDNYLARARDVIDVDARPGPRGGGVW